MVALYNFNYINVGVYPNNYPEPHPYPVGSWEYEPIPGFTPTLWRYRIISWRTYPLGRNFGTGRYYPPHTTSVSDSYQEFYQSTQPTDSSIPYEANAPLPVGLLSSGIYSYSGTESGYFLNESGVPTLGFAPFTQGGVLIGVNVLGYLPPPPLNKPNYCSLLGGYELDARIVPDYPVVRSSVTKSIRIKYYRINKLEPIPNLKSICWMVYACDLVENEPYTLPIVDCVLGTLYSNDPAFNSLLATAENIAGYYHWSDLLPSAISELFIDWMQLYTPTIPPNVSTETRRLCKLGANNDVWSNTNLIGNSDYLPFNTNDLHPMNVVDDERAYDWHIKPQLNSRALGELIMIDPVTLEIHRALDAGKWGVNTVNPLIPRKDNLGWRINRGNEVLGIRVKPDGTIDEELEKTDNRRLHSEGDERNDIQEYNPNCFGSKGMLVRHLPNKFSASLPIRTVGGGYRKVKDIPQLLAEMHEQANSAMGYQEGTAIEINLDGKTYRYANQLALITELFIMSKQTAVYSKGAFFSSVIGEQSIKEVIAGLGLRTVDKYLEFKVANKVVKLYYKGISASQSVRRKLSAVATNVGVVIGNII